jgi:hypothetical protein
MFMELLAPAVFMLFEHTQNVSITLLQTCNVAPCI